MTNPFDVLVEEMKREARKSFYGLEEDDRTPTHNLDTLITQTAHAVREATTKQVVQQLKERGEEAVPGLWYITNTDFNGTLTNAATLSTKDTPTT